MARGGARFFETHKALQNPLALSLRNAGTTVADESHDLADCLSGPDHDCGPSGCVTQRVLDQVDDCLGDELPVSFDKTLPIGLRRQCLSSILGERCMGFAKLAYQL